MFIIHITSLCKQRRSANLSPDYMFLFEFGPTLKSLEPHYPKKSFFQSIIHLLYVHVNRYAQTKTEVNEQEPAVDLTKNNQQFSWPHPAPCRPLFVCLVVC